MSGRVLGFGGRILITDKKADKYVNSPESLIYHKSKVLYGIYDAKQSIAKEDNCYLVEGYTDVIQFHQTGIRNVVSSSGTALTSEQIRLEKEDKERIERVKSMMEVSNRLRLDMMRIALDMDEKAFTEKVFQWAKQFKFLIDGDYLIVNQDTVEDFLNDLSTGAGILLRRGLKISCQFCDKKIDSNAKICPYCGKEVSNS